ncbi:hypothetical protein WJX72_006129 [[Myrmecia] bisecta]|uniref:Uncharacterized protein n=1 Tax=[Myrmecia] bisecta TaxID=41462 RepID=A0AAW1R7H3_9CHLO
MSEDAEWQLEPGLPGSEADPSVFALADRKVRGDVDEEETSLYMLCRRWVQNDPDLPDPTVLTPQVPSILPPLPPATEAADDDAASSLPLQPPIETPDAQRPIQNASIEALLRRHQQHWAKVRKYQHSKNQARITRHRQRLSALLPRCEALMALV